MVFYTIYCYRTTCSTVLSVLDTSTCKVLSVNVPFLWFATVYWKFRCLLMCYVCSTSHCKDISLVICVVYPVLRIFMAVQCCIVSCFKDIYCWAMCSISCFEKFYCCLPWIGYLLVCGVNGILQQGYVLP